MSKNRWDFIQTSYLDYQFDWSNWLADGEIIVEATCGVSPVGLTVAKVEFTDMMVSVWVTGGDVRKTYVITCSITTSVSRKDSRSIELYVKERRP
jgi:hypothetical protein